MTGRPAESGERRPAASGERRRRRSPLLSFELLATPSATLRLLYDRVVSIAVAAVLLVADRPSTSVLRGDPDPHHL
ncbi:vegetative cell wall protein gp1-like [Iris pallida]|uniref:Vegetative cell wall protein gp1-like n=1 Tax=Iris pallida TaxID=29817 RepID=A0AAX6FUI5_IRIPA|nr:vegetative cell wall protein gp1-like [Iris pallida]KAJ6820062.1 vegetative cell wall protein gp1-like [Iris pallida]